MKNQPKIEHLIKSIANGASTVQLEIESKEVDLDEVGMHGRTPLMVAAAEGFLSVNAFINGARVTGTFRTIEEPILNLNPNVFKYTYHY